MGFTGKYTQSYLVQTVIAMIAILILSKIILYFTRRFYQPSFKQKQLKEEKRYENTQFDVQKFLKKNKKNILIKFEDVLDASALFSEQTHTAEIWIRTKTRGKYHFALTETSNLNEARNLFLNSIPNFTIDYE